MEDDLVGSPASKIQKLETSDQKKMREREITRKVKKTTVSKTFCASPAGGYACLLIEL